MRTKRPMPETRGYTIMATISLGQAAKLAGVGKTTLSRAIKAGKLSASRRDDGSYEIDPAELSRVYEIKSETPETVTATRSVVHHATPTVTPDATTQVELTGARQLIELLKVQVEDLRGNRDGWRQQAEASQRLLTHVQQVPEPALRSWWKRLAG
jgi:hypothetical protein